MLNLIETKERWTRLRHFSRRTDHDSNEQSKEQGAKQEQQAVRNFVKTDWSPYLAKTLRSPMTREDDREQTPFQDHAVLVHSEAWTLWVGRRAFFRV